MNYILTSLLLLMTTYGSAQIKSEPTVEDALKKYDFIQGQIIIDNDTIIYYLKNYQTKPKNVVVFIQGSDANPIFSFDTKEGKHTIYRWFVDDYQKLDSTYTFAIIPKPGMNGIYNDTTIQIPQEYYENNYLDYRVKQVDLSIHDIIENHLEEPDEIIVYGHSEGAAIGASLATVNKRITHLGFWSGNVLNNFYEFSLFNRIAALRNEMTDEQAHENIEELLDWYSDITVNPNSTELDRYGFTNKRWATYEKAPIEDLTELDIPIYALFGSADESTPVETAYLLPVKFIEKRKANLTFEVCMGCDHGYQIESDDGSVSTWDEQFEKFMTWVKAN